MMKGSPHRSNSSGSSHPFRLARQIPSCFTEIVHLQGGISQEKEMTLTGNEHAQHQQANKCHGGNIFKPLFVSH